MFIIFIVNMYNYGPIQDKIAAKLSVKITKRTLKKYTAEEKIKTKYIYYIIDILVFLSG